MFNIFRRKKQDKIKLVDEVISLKETVIDQQVIIKDLQETINKQEKVLYGENGIIAKLNKQEVIIEKPFINTDKNNPNTYRKYGKWAKTACPTIIDVYSDGTLKTKNGTAIYNIFDLLKLKELIPNLKEYPTWSNIRDKVNLNNKSTIKYLCYAIETGKYDDIFKKWDKISKDHTITFDEKMKFNPEKEFIKKYNTYASRKYTVDGFYFDGFNFKITRGKSRGNIICNIITLQNILDNFEGVLMDSITNIDAVSNELGFINSTYFKRTINTLINKPKIFTDYLNYYIKKHSFKLNGELVIIDNQFTGLRLKDIEYINTIIVNNTNIEKSIIKLINHFNGIKVKYIVLICIQHDKIPSNWFKKDKKSFLINNPQKRKEKGMM